MGSVRPGLEQDEARATAEEAAAVSRDRGMRWSLARAAHILGQARAAAGVPGVEEAFEEAAEAAQEVGLSYELGLIEEDRRAVAAGLAAGPASRPSKPALADAMDS